jgi:Domain of unknown function (DUF4331)
MRTTSGKSSRRRVLGTAAAVLVAVAATSLPVPAGDHRDGPIFVNTATHGTSDINDIYVFRSPANASNTVFFFSFQPFPGNLTPLSVDSTQVYDIKIDTTGDAVEDIVFRLTFGAPDANGVQDVTLRGLPAAAFPGTGGILAQGRTGTTAPTGVNIPIRGGGTFRCGIHDDPFFFDAGAFATLESTGAGFPRPPGQAHNFFGPNVNTFAAIIEIPSNRIPIPANNPNKIIGVFVTITGNGQQLDFMGRPSTNTALIPPSPRSHLARGERRNAFNAAQPKDHRAAAPLGFRDDMIFVLTDPQGFFKRSANDASFLADALLPDLLMFQIGNPGGFGTLIGGAGSPGFFGTGPFAGGQVLGNGRQFRDDVVDIEFNLLTNGLIPSDNVGDDNGLKVTDGSVDPVSNQVRAIAFPYAGLANLPLNGPGTGPNP